MVLWKAWRYTITNNENSSNSNNISKKLLMQELFQPLKLANATDLNLLVLSDMLCCWGLKSPKSTLYSPKLLHCILKSPFSGWEGDVILLWPGWVYAIWKESEILKKYFGHLSMSLLGTLDHDHAWSISHLWHCCCNVLYHNRE